MPGGVTPRDIQARTSSSLPAASGGSEIPAGVVGRGGAIPLDCGPADRTLLSPGCIVDDITASRWRAHLPAVLILGSPAAAAGMAHGVCLAGHFLLPEVDWVTVVGAVALRLNVLLGPVGAVAGAIRVGGTVPTRVAVAVASVVFAAAAYLAAVGLAFTLISGYADRYGID